MRRLGAVVGVVMGLSLSLAIPDVGAHGGDTTKIHACVVPSSGTIHIINASGSCKPNESPLDWRADTPTADRTGLHFVDARGRLIGYFVALNTVVALNVDGVFYNVFIDTNAFVPDLSLVFQATDCTGPAFAQDFSTTFFSSAVVGPGQALWVKDGQNGKFFSAKLQEPREAEPLEPEEAADEKRHKRTKRRDA